MSAPFVHLHNHSDYSLLEMEDPARLDAYAGTGNAHSIAANRLSYLLDLHGADERAIDARAVRGASAAVKKLLAEWFAAGWIAAACGSRA